MSGIDPRRYLLSEQDSARIFREEIVPELLVQARAAKRPVAVFVAGQPGAGKTMTTSAVMQALEARGGVTVVNSDYYKPYHPQYAQLMATDDTTAAPYTSLDGRRWMAQAEAYLIERRANIVIETTMRDVGDFQEPAAMFRGAGYEVEAVIMAVPEPLSRLGILSRYEQQVAASGAGRLTETANHDASYAGVMRAAEEIDADQIVDRVSVWRRGNVLVYANELTTGGATWSEPARSAQVLSDERARPLTNEQAAGYLRDFRQLLASTSPAVRGQLSQVQALARPLLPPGFNAAVQAAVSFPVSARHATRPRLEGPGHERARPRLPTEKEERHLEL